MSTTLNTYTLFENNQVLTSTQLNEVVAYLDQQTRLSRVRLIGMGALCGLYPSVMTDPLARTTNGAVILSISEGTGITSEGFLINIGKCDLTQFRSYTVPVDFPYAPFVNPATQLQVPLYEMLPSSFMPVPGDPNVPSPITYDFLSGNTPGDAKVVMMFLECVDINNDTCLGSTCDDKGKTRTITLRKLLVSINDLQVILANTGSFDFDFPDKFNLPDLLELRALYDSGSTNTSNYGAFSQQYRSAVSNVYRQNFSDPLGIINVLQQTYTIFEPILKDTYGSVNPFVSIPHTDVWNQIVNGVNSVANGPSYLGIQYFYDFIKDLILAYDEFRDAAFDMMSDCCLDMGLFPKHLLLGEAIAVDDCKPSVYRNDFISVPLTPQQRVARKKLEFYFMRMVLMVRNFDYARIHNPPVKALPLIKITPSFEKISKLSQRSIPYYYKIDQYDPDLNTTLEAVWDFRLVERCKKNAAGDYPVVAYDNQALNQNAPIDPIQTPLYFGLDKFDFYRIEGCLRHPQDDAKAYLEDLKAAFNLPFNVVTVRLAGQSTRADILNRCNFEDLRSQYTAFRNELACKAQKFLNSIAVSFENGKVYRPRPLPDFLLQLIKDSETGGHGNSSVAFLPSVFVAPSAASSATAVSTAAMTEAQATEAARAAAVSTSALITYSPRTLAAVTNDLSNRTNALIQRFQKLGPLLPQSLDTFDYGYTNSNPDTSFINGYLDALLICNQIKALFNELLDHIWHATLNRYPQEMYFTLSLWADEHFYMLNEFILDCTFRNLEAIYYNLEYRINYLLSKDPSLFSNFVAANPGIDHKAGVQPGGTIVLVYPGTALNFSIKTRDAVAAQLQTKKNLEVEFAQLSATKGLTDEQAARLNVVQLELCNIYAVEATSPRPRPTPIQGISVPSFQLQGIQIGADEVIADFALPYLTNCDCDCSEIPAPTPDKLAIPSVIPPAFYEYKFGDYAFATDFATTTYGCSTITPINIDISQHINYLGTKPGSEAFVRVKFIVNGSDTPATATTAPTSIQTVNGSTVTITNFKGLVQGFRFIPARSFTGIDQFKYVFEVYDSVGNVIRRSNEATIIVSITARCTTPNVVTTQATAVAIDTPVGTA